MELMIKQIYWIMLKNIFHKGQNIKVSIMKQAIRMINMVFVRMLLDMD